MLQTLKQFSESTAYAISMLVMELMVLLLIAYEVGTEIYHKRKTGKRTSAIFGLISRGHILQSNAPREIAGEEKIREWVNSVHDWEHQTADLLKGCSPQAVTVFQHGIRHDAAYPGVASNAQRAFGLLLLRIDNLQGIMEKPSVYF